MVLLCGFGDLIGFGSFLVCANAHLTYIDMHGIHSIFKAPLVCQIDHSQTVLENIASRPCAPLSLQAPQVHLRWRYLALFFHMAS